MWCLDSLAEPVQLTEDAYLLHLDTYRRTFPVLSLGSRPPDCEEVIVRPPLVDITGLGVPDAENELRIERRVEAEEAAIKVLEQSLIDTSREYDDKQRALDVTRASLKSCEQKLSEAGPGSDIRWAVWKVATLRTDLTRHRDERDQARSTKHQAIQGLKAARSKLENGLRRDTREEAARAAAAKREEAATKAIAKLSWKAADVPLPGGPLQIVAPASDRGVVLLAAQLDGLSLQHAPALL